jgi:hypothetical protein
VLQRLERLLATRVPDEDDVFPCQIKQRGGDNTQILDECSVIGAKTGETPQLRYILRYWPIDHSSDLLWVRFNPSSADDMP